MRHPSLTAAPGRRAWWKFLIFPLFLPILASCSVVRLQLGATPTPVPTQGTPLPTPLPPMSEIGTSKAPLILALPPSGHKSEEVEAAGTTLTGLIQQNTGYKVVAVLPPTEADLVQGFANGNAHIGVLSPFAYLLASNEGSVEAAFAREQAGEIFYGSQFIARVDTGFTPYFDWRAQANSAEAPVALNQFQDKKPCWTDQRSPSGYVVPLGYLNEAKVLTRDPAFLAGHVAVVRAIDVGGICDFGATYIDARNYPGLQDEYPDIFTKVEVIWRIPPIIPYETLVFAHGMEEDMRRNLTRAFVDLQGTPEGKSAMQTLYGFQSMQVVQDGQYELFRRMVRASGLDLETLIQ